LIQNRPKHEATPVCTRLAPAGRCAGGCDPNALGLLKAVQAYYRRAAAFAITIELDAPKLAVRWARPPRSADSPPLSRLGLSCTGSPFLSLLSASASGSFDWGFAASFVFRGPLRLVVFGQAISVPSHTRFAPALRNGLALLLREPRSWPRQTATKPPTSRSKTIPHSNSKLETKAVYHIRTYGETDENGKQSSKGTRVGVAFVNSDASLSVVLDSLPIDGKLHIRDFPERKGSQSQIGHTPPGLSPIPVNEWFRQLAGSGFAVRSQDPCGSICGFSSYV
jgi:hypothetical protein